MKVTIYDVAKEAGVSISTASKALNDRKDVGEETKKRIKEIAKRLNYEPSHFARALARKRTDNIGVITIRYYKEPMITNPFYSKIIEGIEEVIMQENMNLLTNVLRKEQVENLEIPKMIKEKNVDGIILLGFMPKKYVEMIINKGIPVVLADNYFDDLDVSSVVVDNFNGAYDAVKYLIDTGHRYIGFLSGPSIRWSFRQRYEGYKKAIKDYNLGLDDSYVIFNTEEEEGYKWMERILKNEKLDALFLCNDVHAILAINMLKEKGKKVPDDISVVGFDNIDLTQHFIPSITTVNINKEEIGRKATQILLNILNNKLNQVEKIVCPTQLIIRNSVKSRIKV